MRWPNALARVLYTFNYLIWSLAASAGQASDLQETWRKTFDALGYSTCLITYSGDVIVNRPQLWGGVVVEKLAKEDGHVVWTRRFGELSIQCQDNNSDFYAVRVEGDVRLHVLKLASSSGETIWEKILRVEPQGGSYYFVRVGLQGTNLIVLTKRGTTRMTIDGDILWTIPESGSWAEMSPNGDLFLITEDYLNSRYSSDISKYDGRTGTRLWSRVRQGRVVTTGLLSSGDLVWGGDLQGDNQNSHAILEKISGSTGATLWTQVRFSTSFRAWYKVLIIVTDGTALFTQEVGGTREDGLTVVTRRDIETGEELWQFAYPARVAPIDGYIDEIGNFTFVGAEPSRDQRSILKLSGEGGQILSFFAFPFDRWLKSGDIYLMGDGLVLVYLVDKALPPRVHLSRAETSLDLHITGMGGTPVQLQTSTDLSYWSVLTVITPAGTDTATYSISNSAPRRYYRAIHP